MPNNNPGEHQSHPRKSEDDRNPSAPNQDEESREDKGRRHGADNEQKGGGRSGNRGNFANDPERARKAGQKGGKA
jgi:general stress protein YciG